jgi:hypothetical protein
MEAGRQLYADLPAGTFKTEKAAIQFVRDQEHKMEKYGSVRSRYAQRRTPNPKKVPDDVALRCSDAFKKGYTREYRMSYKDDVPAKRPCKKKAKVTKTLTVKIAYHDYYRDIRVACDLVPLLRETVDFYDVTPHHLLERMKQADPTLVVRSRDLKRWLSPPEMKKRVEGALRNLETLKTEGDSWLHSIVFVDEFALWMVPAEESRRVYCDVRDMGVHDVVPIVGLKGNKKVKIHILAAVNWHLGAFFMEFTTGTTDIERLHHEPAKPYKVSCCSSRHPLNSVFTVTPQPMQSLR